VPREHYIKQFCFMRITMLSKFKAVLHYLGNNNISDNYRLTITTTQVIIKNVLNPQEVNQLSLINIIVIYMYLTINIKKKRSLIFLSKKTRFDLSNILSRVPKISNEIR